MLCREICNDGDMDWLQIQGDAQTHRAGCYAFIVTLTTDDKARPMEEDVLGLMTVRTSLAGLDSGPSGP